MTRSSLRLPAARAVESPGTSASLRKPWFVHSNVHDSATTGMMPRPNAITTQRMLVSGKPKIGTRVSSTCTTSHALAR